MNEEIFNQEEFNDLQAAQIQQKAQEVYQRFVHLKAYYQNFRNSPFINPEDWIDLSENFQKFDTNYNVWNRQWSAISRQRVADPIIKFFESGRELFEGLDVLIEKARPKLEQSESIEELKEEMLRKLDSEMVTLTNKIELKVSDGIQNLIDLKAEYKLQDKFATSIQNEKAAAESSRKTYLNLFIASVIVIPVFLLLSFIIPGLQSMEGVMQWAVRGTISITLGLLSMFLFNQYRVSRLLLLKYTHLNNFLGGGVTFVSELIGLNDETKKEMNKKLANMFIDIDDLMNSIRRNRHPSVKAMDSASKLIDTVAKNTAEITKSLK